MGVSSPELGPRGVSSPCLLVHFGTASLNRVGRSGDARRQHLRLRPVELTCLVLLGCGTKGGTSPCAGPGDLKWPNWHIELTGCKTCVRYRQDLKGVSSPYARSARDHLPHGVQGGRSSLQEVTRAGVARSKTGTICQVSHGDLVGMRSPGRRVSGRKVTRPLDMTPPSGPHTAAAGAGRQCRGPARYGMTESGRGPKNGNQGTVRSNPASP